MDTAFTRWMSEVDHYVDRVVGVSVHDLPDIPFMNAYEDGMTPEDTVETYAAELGIQEFI